MRILDIYAIYPLLIYVRGQGVITGGNLLLPPAHGSFFVLDC
jgi:hypothetical protein